MRLRPPRRQPGGRSPSYAVRGPRGRPSSTRSPCRVSAEACGLGVSLMFGWALPEGLLRDAPAYAPAPPRARRPGAAPHRRARPADRFPHPGRPGVGRAQRAAGRRHAVAGAGSRWRCRPRWSPRSTRTNPLKRVLVARPTRRARRSPRSTRSTSGPPGRAGAASADRCGGSATAAHGSFRRLRLTPAEVTPLLPPGRVLGVIADRPLHRPQLAQIAYAARTIAGHVLIIIPVAAPGPRRAARRRRWSAPSSPPGTGCPPATIVAVPLARRGDEIADALLRSRVAEAYGATHLLAGGTRDVRRRRRARCCRASSLRRPGRPVARRRRHPAPAPPGGADRRRDRRTCSTGASPLPEWHTPAGGRPRAGPGPPAAAGPRPGRLLHRAVRLRASRRSPGASPTSWPRPASAA